MPAECEFVQGLSAPIFGPLINKHSAGFARLPLLLLLLLKISTAAPKVPNFIHSYLIKWPCEIPFHKTLLSLYYFFLWYLSKLFYL
ncbi:hypothetical protein D7Z54_20620 [Salibacterium salarium]|uniref:Uncharacterized protein n=1 Tax=Salibacterium salarium TaxID=284579 RepID=A0A428MZC7_9BACI|nr:hypothetical protein D7Z54_20620 [Salibacterium salarium]